MVAKSDMTGLPSSSKLGGWFRRVLSCCEREDEEEEARSTLQIGAPTDFRRQDVSIPGLDPEQQSFLRTKAIADAQKLYAHLQPLRSSPNGHFVAADGYTESRLPSYEEFTTPRPAPAPSPVASPTTTATPTRPGSKNGEGGFVGSLKRHSRKLSNSLTNSLGYHHSDAGNGSGAGRFGAADVMGREDSKYEMRALMDPSQSRIVSPMPGKLLSGESFNGSGSEFGDGDSGKGMVKI